MLLTVASLMFVSAIPDMDGDAAFAGTIPIQTTPAITAVLNTRVRIDFASLTLKHLRAKQAQHDEQLGLVCRGERQTLQGKSPKLSRISHTVSSKLDQLPTDLATKLLSSVRLKNWIKNRLMRFHYQPDRFKSLR